MGQVFIGEKAVYPRSHELFLILDPQSGRATSFIKPVCRIQFNNHELSVYHVLDAELVALNQR